MSSSVSMVTLSVRSVSDRRFGTNLIRARFKPFNISTYLTSGILCAIMCLLAKTGGRVILPSSLGPSLVEGLSYGSIKKQRVYSLSNSYSK